MSYEVAIYITGNLYAYSYSNYGDAMLPQKRVDTYLQGAESRIGIDITPLTPSETIPAPTELAYDHSFTAESPCYNVEKEYPNLLTWWREYIDCKLSSPADDSNILISNADNVNGGVAGVGGYAATAQTGRYLCDLPSYYTYSGSSAPHDAFDTVLHEIGHNLTDGGIYNKYPYNPDPAHDLGAKFTSGVDSRSPLALNGTINQCGDDISSTQEFEHTFGSCTLGNLK